MPVFSHVQPGLQTRQVSAQVDVDDIAALQRIARLTDRTLSSLTREGLRYVIDRYDEPSSSTAAA